MRIALFTPDLQASAGGPPRVVLGSAMALAALGHMVTIFTFAADERSADGIEVCVFPVDRPTAIGRSRAMRAAVARRLDQFDVLHVHAVWEAGAADLAALFAHAGKRVLVSAHGMLDRWSMRQSAVKKRFTLRFLWTRRLFACASAIVFATQEEAAEGAGVSSRTPRAIVANGIDIAETRSRIASGSTDFRARFPQIAGWPRTIVYLSRIHPKKGIDQLIEARLALEPRFDDVGMLIVGIAQDAPLLEAITQRIDRSRLPQRFILTTDLVGTVAMAALRAAQIFALPSHQEGFSIAILEAMAAGLPVLITDKCHLPEVETWQAGVVTQDTVAGLVIGLERMLDLSDDALAAMGENAASAVEAHYSWRSIAESLVALYVAGSAE